MGIFRLLFLAIVFYLIYKLVRNLLFPRQPFNRPGHNEPKKNYGETTVNVPKNDSEKNKNKSGDYIDYEEVD